MERHAAVPLPWEVDPAVRGHGGSENGVQCGTSESFKSHRALRQGDGLSFLLFNIPLEGVI